MDTSSGDDNIVFSDNDSYLADKEESVIVNPNVLYQGDNVKSDHSSEQLSAKFKEQERGKDSNDSLDKLSKSMLSYGKETGKSSSSRDDVSDVLDEESDVEESRIEEGLVESEVEPVLGEF